MSGMSSNSAADSRAGSMIKWTIIATVVQLAMVVSGHYVEFIKNNVFAIGGMLISLVFAACWVRGGATGWAHAAWGGVVVGGVCALIGIAVSCALGDVEAAVLGFGTAGSAVAGLIGGTVAYAVAGPKPSSNPTL
jgi:hypothetical protein